MFVWDMFEGGICTELDSELGRTAMLVLRSTEDVINSGAQAMIMWAIEGCRKRCYGASRWWKDVGTQ